jgi:hypothetical protein
MKAVNIATVTVTTDGRLLYAPTEKFLALGMTEVDLGADKPDARREVVSLNYDARQRKRHAKDMRTGIQGQNFVLGSGFSAGAGRGYPHNARKAAWHNLRLLRCGANISILSTVL